MFSTHFEKNLKNFYETKGTDVTTEENLPFFNVIITGRI